MEISIDVHNPSVRGPLTLFALFSTGIKAAPYVCGPDAAERKLFEVQERSDGARVPELEISNRSDKPLLLIEGEMLVGAKQNRTLNVSVICNPLGVTVIPVSCVEAGRWGRPREGGRSRFHAGLSLREKKMRAVYESVRRGAGKASDQGEVWKTVDAYAVRHGVRSATMNYEDVLDGIEGRLEDLTKGLEPAEGQHGVLVGIAGRVRCMDVFDRPSTLRAYWNSLLSGYANDAIGEEPLATSAEDAEAFVEKIVAAKFEEVPAVGLGRESHLVSDDLTVAALRWGQATVHLAAFALQKNGARSRMI
jgi:hypothetical protein